MENDRLRDVLFRESELGAFKEIQYFLDGPVLYIYGADNKLVEAIEHIKEYAKRM